MFTANCIFKILNVKCTNNNEEYYIVFKKLISYSQQFNSILKNMNNVIRY